LIKTYFLIGKDSIRDNVFLMKGCSMSVVSLTTYLCLLLAPLLADMGTLETDSQVTAQQSVRPELPKRWLTSYAEASAMAASNKLPLLLHFDAPWCGACRQMDQSVLNQPEITALLGTKVIGVRLNADYNKDLIAEFGISSLPTEVVVLADGSRGSRYLGATTLNSYVARLNAISGNNSAVVARTETKIAQSSAAAQKTEPQNLRACLIVKHDGKMVGLGGFSPISLKANRKWKRGIEEFVVEHEGVCYYFGSDIEVQRFKANPSYYIPRLHGCDLVELSQENRALPGAIEYGAFYKDQVYFFASLENRIRFEQNPGWFLAAATDAYIENEDGYPFLKSLSANN
jgi:YHS domain-containing protein/thiol-disulfide isomerase/thioredoxin